MQTFGWLSVEDNVLAAMEWRGGGGGFLADVVGWRARRPAGTRTPPPGAVFLPAAALPSVREQLAGSLPIGIARMVELAGPSPTNHPALLDEPASGLDAAEVARLGEEIQKVRSAGECAVLLVEHNAGFVMENCDRVIVLDRGRVLAHGTPEEIQQNKSSRPPTSARWRSADHWPRGPSEDQR